MDPVRKRRTVFQATGLKIRKRRKTAPPSSVPSSSSDGEISNSFDDISKLLRLKTQAIGSRLDFLNRTKVCINTSYEVLYTWNKYQPHIIDRHRHQSQNDCWRYALARGQSCLVKRLGLESTVPILTPEILLNLDPTFVSEEDGSLKKGFRNTIDFLKTNGFVQKMTIHQRKEDDKHFEKLLQRLLPISPVILVFSILPSYHGFNGNKGVYVPTVQERHALKFEKFPKHTVLATGHGVVIRGSDFTRFVEVHDSFGKNWGENGFIKFALHWGIIKQIIELPSKLAEVNGAGAVIEAESI